MARKSAEPVEEFQDLLHPKWTEQWVGHAQVEKQLLQLVQSKRLPHALLFTGSHGIGKATLAYRLARFLLAPQETGGGLFGDALPPESLHMPASHPIFRRMALSAHPDLLVLEGDTIKVEEARKVGQFLSLTPAESEWRVVIIDSVDAMNRNAANALLKILEEPPAQAVLILISHTPGGLLPTIRSRCRQVRFDQLNDADFARIVSRIAPETMPGDLIAYALLSGHSPGVAARLMAADAEKMYRELLAVITAHDTVKLHGFTDRFARKDAQANWEILTKLLLWLIARLSTLTVSEQELFAGERAQLERIRAGKPLDFWLELWEKAGNLIHDTDNLHLDKKQALLTLLRAMAD